MAGNSNESGVSTPEGAPRKTPETTHHIPEMEVAASLVGLLAVGAKIGMTLHEFVSNCADAPTIAQTISDEIRDFRFALSKLQPYVRKNNPSQMTLLGASMTDVNHLSLTISSCIVTFGRLEKIVDKLKPGNQMDTLTRLKWSWSETAISQLVQRLQQHKITLTLLLTIWLRYVSIHFTLI